jgi:undecaprenyl diphosphate synthase
MGNIIPLHVAIIMDGNGRWALKRFLPRIAGYKKGVDTAQNIVKCAEQLGVKYLTLFVFSTENWLRPKIEVDFLLNLIAELLHDKLSEFLTNNVKLNIFGNIQALPLNLQNAIKQSIAATKDNTGLTLNLAINYGGRWDLANAVKQIIREQVNPEIVDENLLSKYLAFANIPDPDLLIRTSGEMRLSNFMLWNLAYSEMYFTETLWPDFDSEAFSKAIEFYGTRQRRFGKVVEHV